MPQRDIDEVFWENVAKYLTEKKLTKTQVVKELNLPVNFFSSYKRRKDIPKAKQIQTLCQYLDLEYIDLFEDWS